MLNRGYSTKAGIDGKGACAWGDIKDPEEVVKPMAERILPLLVSLLFFWKGSRTRIRKNWIWSRYTNLPTLDRLTRWVKEGVDPVLSPLYARLFCFLCMKYRPQQKSDDGFVSLHLSVIEQHRLDANGRARMGWCNTQSHQC